MEYDVFISYATEDEETFVAHLAAILNSLDVKVWFAPAILKVGDSLSRSIDKGLANSKFGVVVLSKAFIAKHWPEYELRGLISKAVGKDKVILPIWHKISREEVLKFSPPLADTIALDTSKLDLREIALKITEIVRPDIFNKLLRLQTWERVKRDGKREIVPIGTLKDGPIRHKSLPDSFLVRAKIINHTLFDVLPISLEETIDSFRREFNPIEEIICWENIVAAYLDATYGKELSIEKRRDIVSALLGWSTGSLSEEKAHKFENLSYEEVVDIGKLYLNVIPKIVDDGTKTGE